MTIGKVADKPGPLKIPILSYVYECVQLTCLCLLLFSEIQSKQLFSCVVFINIIYFFSQATTIYRVGLVLISIASTQANVVIKS